jgi:predicted nuclease of predicted toxin-antitoxin system
MVKIYADEDFSLHVVAMLQERGYDIETPHDHDNARKGIPDHDVLAFAVSLQRAVMTHNRDDFKRLHHQYQRAGTSHFGIINCTRNPDDKKLALSIDTVLAKHLQKHGSIENSLVLVYKGSV